MRSFGGLVLAGLVLGGLPVAAHATPEVDQSYTAPLDGTGMFSNGSFRRAETFTVGITGTLDKVLVYATTDGYSFSFTGINVLSTASGVPTTNVLDVGSYATAGSYLNAGNGVAVFTVSLPVTVGEVLAI